MPTRRQIQVADEIQQIISYLLQRELKDPRFGFATITRVEVTSDFKYARVFVSVMGTEQEQQETMAAFNSSRGFIRRELASRMQIRQVPDLQFKLDLSAEYSDRINRLLNELRESEAARRQTAQTENVDGGTEDEVASPDSPTPIPPQQERE